MTSMSAGRRAQRSRICICATRTARARWTRSGSAETVSLIREKCDIVLNLTTSGDLNATDETRMAHIIELKPELASYDAGTMNWMHSALFINHPAFLESSAM